MSEPPAPPRPNPKPLRGEVWEFDLTPGKGREQKGVRPCLVVSTEGVNRAGFGTVVVCPVATTQRPEIPWRPGSPPPDLREARALRCRSVAAQVPLEGRVGATGERLDLRLRERREGGSVQVVFGHLGDLGIRTKRAAGLSAGA